MVQVLEWLHVLVKVDVHGEGRVCVMRGIEVGDGTGGQAQAAQHCVETRVGVQGPRPGQGWGGQVRHEVRSSKGTRATGSGVARVRRALSQGVLGVRGIQATGLALSLTVPSPSSPLGPSRLLTLINDN